MITEQEIEAKTLPLEQLKDIEARAERVSALIRKSATLWLDIAREVFDAKRSLSPDAFSIFLQKASLTPAIADKMPTIAKASELYTEEAKAHLHRFEGWSPIYEVAKLKSSEKKAFFDALKNDPEAAVSRGFIQSFRKSNRQTSKPAIIVAVIKLDDSDVKRLDFEQFSKIREMLNDFARRIDVMSPAISFELKESVIDEIEANIMNEETDIDTENEQFFEQTLEAA